MKLASRSAHLNARTLHREALAFGGGSHLAELCAQIPNELEQRRAIYLDDLDLLADKGVECQGDPTLREAREGSAGAHHIDEGNARR